MIFQGFFYVAEDDIDKKYSFGYNKKENTERVIGEKRLCVQQLLIKQKTFILEERWIMNFLMVIMLLLHLEASRFIFDM